MHRGTPTICNAYLWISGYLGIAPRMTRCAAHQLYYEYFPFVMTQSKNEFAAFAHMQLITGITPSCTIFSHRVFSIGSLCTFCTDSRSARSTSLWPIIICRYNLPPLRRNIAFHCETRSCDGLLWLLYSFALRKQPWKIVKNYNITYYNYCANEPATISWNYIV